MLNYVLFSIHYFYGKGCENSMNYVVVLQDVVNMLLFSFLTGLGNLLGKVSSCEDHFGKSMSSVLEDDIHGKTAGVSEEDHFSLCVSQYKTRNFQKVKTGKSRKNIFQTNTDECEEAKKQMRENKHSFVSEVEPSDSAPPFDSNLTGQRPCGNGGDTGSKAAVPSSASEWSQLTLSGFSGGMQRGKIPPLDLSPCDQSNSDKDLTGTQKERTNSLTLEDALPHTSRETETEKVFSQETLVNKRSDRQCPESHQDSTPGEKHVVPETSRTASPLQGVKKSIFRISESPEDRLSETFSSSIPDANLKGPVASGSGLGMLTVGSQTEPPSCTSSAGNGSGPATVRHSSVALKSSSLISTWRKKTKKFIYVVNDETSYQGLKREQDQESRLANCSPQFEADAFEAPSTVPSADSGTFLCVCQQFMWFLWMVTSSLI